MIEQRTDDDGLWESEDGVSWMLVTPSEAFLATRESLVNEPVEEPVDPLEAFRNQLDLRLADPTVNSIAEIKAEIRSALALLG